jgi:hypothetical protein
MKRVVSLCVMLTVVGGGFAADAKAPPQTYAAAVKLATEQHKPLIAWRGYYFAPEPSGAVVYRGKESDGIGCGFWLIVPWSGQMWKLKGDDKSIQAAVDHINSAVPAPVALPMAPPGFPRLGFDALPPMIGGS